MGRGRGRDKGAVKAVIGVQATHILLSAANES